MWQVGSANRHLNVTWEADVSQRESPALAGNLGGTAECLHAFRPIVDGRFFVLYLCHCELEAIMQYPGRKQSQVTYEEATS